MEQQEPTFGSEKILQEQLLVLDAETANQPAEAALDFLHRGHDDPPVGVDRKLIEGVL